MIRHPSLRFPAQKIRSRFGVTAHKIVYFHWFFCGASFVGLSLVIPLWETDFA